MKDCEAAAEDPPTEVLEAPAGPERVITPPLIVVMIVTPAAFVVVSIAPGVADTGMLAGPGASGTDGLADGVTVIKEVLVTKTTVGEVAGEPGPPGAVGDCGTGVASTVLLVLG